MSKHFYNLSVAEGLSKHDMKCTNHKGKIDRFDCIKMKNFCTAEDVINKIERQMTNWKKAHMTEKV